MVYNPKDSKLRPQAYCSVFKDMFFALIERFNCKCFVTGNCHADQIDADVIFYFDPHASHHVEIEGIEKHPAIKMEFWNDIHQKEFRGVYTTTGVNVHKLGQEQRAKRSEKRDVKYIVSTVKYFFYEQFSKYFGDNTEKMLLYFPQAPTGPGKPKPLIERKQTILGNGATHGGWGGGYDFRAWAFEQQGIEVVKHWIFDKNTPSGQGYLDFLSGYAGALALCTPCPVPKYYEMPMAGCVTFAEYHKEYEELGFNDGHNYIAVNKDNFTDRINDFLSDIKSYQSLADAGQKLMEENYTAEHFADFVFNKLNKEVI